MLNIKTLPSNWRDENREYFTETEIDDLLASSYAAFFATCSEDEKKYFSGHRKRFKETLLRMPKAAYPGEKLLDIGGLELTAAWLMLYGYAVTQFNYSPDLPAGHVALAKSVLPVPGGDGTYTLVNVDLDGDWPDDTRYSTIFFTETLEHLSDPFLTLSKLNAIAERDAFIVLTTPNANSLYAFAEFLKGLPACVYRYFNPDMGLSRHQFEQTAYTMCELCELTGFSVKGLSTHCVYGNKEGYPILTRLLNDDGKYLGEVMIACLKKRHEGPFSQMPPCIYDSEYFYKNLDHEFVSIYREKIGEFAATIENVNIEKDAVADEADKQKEVFAEYICDIERMNRERRIDPVQPAKFSLMGLCKNKLHNYPRVYSILREIKRILVACKNSSPVQRMYRPCKTFIKVHPLLHRIARKIKALLLG